MKLIITEEEKRTILNQYGLIQESLIDRIKDKWFDIVIAAKAFGIALPKSFELAKLKKAGDTEGYERELKSMNDTIRELYKEHPEYEFRSQLKSLKKDLNALNKQTLDSFEKNPSKFSDHQQNILLKFYDLTDDGIKRKEI